jgi:hypothetical protein
MSWPKPLPTGPADIPGTPDYPYPDPTADDSTDGDGAE